MRERKVTPNVACKCVCVREREVQDVNTAWFHYKIFDKYRDVEGRNVPKVKLHDFLNNLYFTLDGHGNVGRQFLSDVLVALTLSPPSLVIKYINGSLR